MNEKNSSGAMNTGTVIVPSRFCCRAFALGISLPLIESEREGIFPVVHDFSEKRVVLRRYHGAKSRADAPAAGCLEALLGYHVHRGSAGH